MLSDLPCERQALQNSQVRCLIEWSITLNVDSSIHFFLQIGRTIMALCTHEKETIPNKVTLKNIIQMWSRLIFEDDGHQVTSWPRLARPMNAVAYEPEATCRTPHWSNRSGGQQSEEKHRSRRMHKPWRGSSAQKHALIRLVKRTRGYTSR